MTLPMLPFLLVPVPDWLYGTNYIKTILPNLANIDLSTLDGMISAYEYLGESTPYYINNTFAEQTNPGTGNAVVFSSVATTLGPARHPDDIQLLAFVDQFLQDQGPFIGKDRFRMATGKYWDLGYTHISGQNVLLQADQFPSQEETIFIDDSVTVPSEGRSELLAWRFHHPPMKIFPPKELEITEGVANVFDPKTLHVNFVGKPMRWTNLDMPGTYHEEINIRCKTNLGIALAKSAVEEKLVMPWLTFIKLGGTIETPGLPSVKISPLIEAGKWNSSWGTHRNDSDSLHYSDHYFDFSFPLDESELTKNPVISPLYVKIDSHYNSQFSDRSFEVQTTAIEGGLTNGLLQRVLPNFYAFMNMLERSSSKKHNNILGLDLYGGDSYDPNDPFKSLLNLGGTLPQYSADFLHKTINQENSGLRPDVPSFMQYFNLWVKHYPDFASEVFQDLKYNGLPSDSNIIRLLGNHFFNVCFTADKTDLLTKYNKNASFFPMWNQIELKATKGNILSNEIKKLMMSRTLMLKAAQATTNVISEPQTTYSMPEIFDRDNGYVANDKWALRDQFIGKKNAKGEDFARHFNQTMSTSEETNFHSRVTLKNLDLIAFLESYVQNGESVFNEDLSKYVAFTDGAAEETVGLAEILKKVTTLGFYAKIKEMAEKVSRTYKDILLGKPAYSEVVMYRIAKEKRLPVPEGPNSPTAASTGYYEIQNFYLPNSSEVDVLKFIDTQVRYATADVYRYKVYAYTVVFGSRYSYFWPDNDETASGIIPFSGWQPGHSSWAEQFVESGALEPGAADGIYYTFTTSQGSGLIGGALKLGARCKVVTRPDVRLFEVPYYTSRDVLVMDKPPMPPDVEIVPYRGVKDKILFNFSPTTGKMKNFPVVINESDKKQINLAKQSQLNNVLENVEIDFETDDDIVSYEIYRTRKKPKSFKDFSENAAKISYHQGFEDILKPNVKYYYTFRAIDTHGHFSNPTAIYEIEMVDDKGAVRPKIRVVELEPEIVKEASKSGRRYIQIKPIIDQLQAATLTDVANENMDLLFVDDTDNSSGGKSKQFKIRVKSKKTGKFVDFNLKFVKKSILT